MSMIHSHPVLDANAHAKAMIDAVTGHQPSPLEKLHASCLHAFRVSRPISCATTAGLNRMPKEA